MKDQIRAEFEQEFPLPNGVTFDGDHYVADPAVIGSFQNATIWSHMYRGWKRRQETLIVYLPSKQIHGNGIAPQIVEAQIVATRSVMLYECKEALTKAGVNYRVG